MDSFEFSEIKGPSRRKGPFGSVWNILTIIVLVSLLCVVSYFTIIFFNPNSILNPFPPPTLFPSVPAPTATMTLRFRLVPSWTPTQGLNPATNTPSTTDTPIATTKPIVPTTTAVPVLASIMNNFAFVVQQGSPAAIPGTQFHPDTGCDWLGVGGQVTSLNDEAVKGVFVQLGGSMSGEEVIDKMTMTGLANQYGDGGFEFTLADAPVATSGTMWIQVLDQQNLPLSDRIYFDTYDDCQKNLIIIYFDQIQ